MRKKQQDKINIDEEEENVIQVMEKLDKIKGTDQFLNLLQTINPAYMA